MKSKFINHCLLSSFISLFLANCLMPTLCLAKMEVVKATGEYIMGDNDTYTEAKKLALQDAKRLVLEKVGTYIESTTEVRNGMVSSDEIKQYTAGIVEVDVTDEQRTIENKATVVKVSVSASVDPDAVVRQVQTLKNRKDTEEKARKLSSENDRLRAEIALLSRQLRNATDEKTNQEIRDQRSAALQKILDNEKGLTLLVSGESLVKASLFDRQRKQDDSELVRRFLQEVADTYRIVSDEPEVEDNGDGTSNVAIRYRIQLPGNYNLKGSRIDVSSGKEFLSKGFVIKAFSNGGLIIRCADFRNSKCNNTLSPYFDQEVRRMVISINLGEYSQTETLGIAEYSGPSRQKSYVADSEPTFKEDRLKTTPPRSLVSRGYPPGQLEPRRTPSPAPDKGSLFQKPEPGGIYYPLVSNGTYTCIFKRIPHSSLQKVSKIEIKVLYR